MIPNPYSLPESKEHARYFTDDITLMPVSSIWRCTRGQSSIPRTFVFAYLVARKVLRKRLPANYATRYPPTLAAISKEEISDEAMQVIANFDSDCHATGMEHVGYFLPNWIGGKRGVLSVSIDQRRKAWCTATWFEIRVGDVHNARVVFACHSETADGTELHTATETSDVWIPQLIPPNVKIERVPSESNASCVIGRHTARVEARTDIVTLDVSSLILLIEQRSLEQLDFMVANGFYAQLTQDEIQRLRQTM